jgi:hypothetical protein
MQTVCGKTWLGGKTGLVAQTLDSVAWITWGYKRGEDKGGKSCLTASNKTNKSGAPKGTILELSSMDSSPAGDSVSRTL